MPLGETGRHSHPRGGPPRWKPYSFPLLLQSCCGYKLFSCPEAPGQERADVREQQILRKGGKSPPGITHNLVSVRRALCPPGTATSLKGCSDKKFSHLLVYFWAGKEHWPLTRTECPAHPASWPQSSYCSETQV